MRETIEIPRTPRPSGAPPRRGRLWLWLFVILGVLYLSTQAVYWWTEWRWFDSLGQAAVLRLRLLAPLALGAVVWLVSTLWLAAAWLWAARRPGPLAGWLVGGSAVRRLLSRQRLLGVAALVSLLPAMAVAGHWQWIWLCLRRRPFGIADPVFGRDVAFYVFELPVLWLAWRLAVQLVILAAVGVLVVQVLGGVFDLHSYARAGGLERVGQRLQRLPGSLRLQLWFAGGLLAGLIALSFWLQRFELLLAPGPGPSFHGPGYTDLTIRLPAYGLLGGLWLAVAALFFLTAARGRAWWPLAGTAVAAMVAVAALALLPTIVQQYRVRPNELALERRYIGFNIAMTRRAFGLDRIHEVEYEPRQDITARILSSSPDTVADIRLWDWRTLLATLRQLQVIRTYYDFLDVDVDRYPVAGGQRQVELAVRELVARNLQNPTWVNRHLEFTHGFGLVVAPVNQVDATGLPVLWLRDIPPRLQAPFDQEVRQPRIYIGEGADDRYVIVGSSTGEFDYPAGAENVRTRYAGADGVPLRGLADRLMFMFRFGDSEILFAQGLSEDSRILFHRHLLQRLRQLAPFLTFDPDPYAVLTPQGRIVWLADAYTASERYPYAQPVGVGPSTTSWFADSPLRGKNYIRNSVKAVVDAYDGSVDFYVVDPGDPLIQAWRGVYPSLFKDAAAMPAELVAHWRYPEALFRAQAEINLRYHMQEPETFYNAEDLWQLPTRTGGSDGTLPLQPYYVTLRLRGEAKAEFLLILPFTPVAKQNMIAWLAARCDPGHYGDLVLYRFAKGRLVLGPQQIDSRIDQDPVISAQFTLWSQRGSQVIRGNLLVIPVGDAILYVEPVYLQAEESALPQLAQVIVASGERVVMRPTLEEALTALTTGRPAPAVASPGAEVAVGKPTPTAEPTFEPTEAAAPPPARAGALPGASVAELVQRAVRHRDAAERALQAGDWQTFGQEMATMRRLLDELAALTALPTPAKP